MTKDDQRTLAEAFRRMHRQEHALLLPNAWDAMSARLFEAAGFGAVASTSGGMAWALGYPDGEFAPWGEIVAAMERIVRVVSVPVTADIEGGYGATPDEVAKSVTDIIRAGVVGVNLEDGTHRPDLPIRNIEDSVDRIRAAREAALAAGVPIVINARIDLYLKHIGDDETRFAETVRRGNAYIAAGADCLFPFGLADLKIVESLVQALKAPINIVGRAGMPDTAELSRLGIARISTASGPAMAILAATKRLADDLRATGAFGGFETELKRADVQQLFVAQSRSDR